MHSATFLTDVARQLNFLQIMLMMLNNVASFEMKLTFICAAT